MVTKIAEYLINHLRLAWIKANKYQLGLNHHAHQLTNTTKTHRYPEIFNAIKQVRLDYPSVTENIMSFGCSTGQECLTIQQYFPDAKIVGVDISRKNLRKCNQTIHHGNIEFLYSNPELIRKKAPFDIIFCMSVLCRWEETEFVSNCEKIYPFEKFEKQLELLDTYLHPGGLLVIYNSNFRFCDSHLYADYQPIESGILDSGFVHKFDKRNQKITNNYNECIFKKLGSKPAFQQKKQER